MKKPVAAPDFDDPRSPVPDWAPCPPCKARAQIGRTVSLHPFEPDKHAGPLWQAFGETAMNARIRWFGWPPLTCAEDLARRLDAHRQNDNWSTNIIAMDGVPVGMASYMREDATNGVVEIGAVAHATAMARSTAATEAHFLLMAHAFDLGYRRYEWKCDDANAASKRAALRLGFTHEGVFRQHMVRHGRNRDTAWFSVLDSEWPKLRSAFKRWLDPANFDVTGRQLTALADAAGG